MKIEMKENKIISVKSIISEKSQAVGEGDRGSDQSGDSGERGRRLGGER